MSEAEEKDPRELKAGSTAKIEAPDLPYQPLQPKKRDTPIALVGCGGIAKNHLDAYKSRGYNVVALCNPTIAKAEALRDEFFPKADVYSDPTEVWSRTDIEVVDLATHPDVRYGAMREALLSGKHVLSQKPFVTDIDKGSELVALAEERDLKLAVNQNGRWAPYFSYLRQVVKAGLLGEIVSCDINIAWDHSWIKGTAFEELYHILLYDFAIHWFDMTACVFGKRQATSVFAHLEKSLGQAIDPPLLANATVRYEGGLATLAFRAHTKYDPAESAIVTGTKGVFRSSGAPLVCENVTLATEEGLAEVRLEGNWFNDGFAGAMGELLCAIEEGREPENSAANNLRSLELCFAAIESAESGAAKKPGEVRSIEL